MPSRYMQLPYRPCVGIMLVNRSGRVCVGQRLPECAMVAPAESWQMPQGSIEPGEPVREAGMRVLVEDMGVSSVQVLAEAPGWFTYELPAHMIGVALKGEYCGQKQKWIAARLLGQDDEIECGHQNGARTWKWVPAADVVRQAPSLKRQLYEDARLAALLVGQLGVLSPAAQARVEKAISVLKNRAKTVAEMANQAAFLISERPLVLDAKAQSSIKDAKERLRRVHDVLVAQAEWNNAALSSALKTFATDEGVGMGQIGPVLRAALTGGAPSPDLGQTLELLGREESLARLADQVEVSHG